MISFNLSEWAIQHRTLVVYFMAVSLVAGFGAYRTLGRNEDPEFTVKKMLVVTEWPGATQQEMMEQITDRIEKKLQETPSLDYVKSFTQAGKSTVYVVLRESTPKQDVPDIWYQVRKKVGDIKNTLPPGVAGPFFNDEFGDTYGIIYALTADGFSHRELRDYAEEVRSRMLEVPDISKVEIVGAQDERIYVEFSPHRLAQMGLDRLALLRAIEGQNAVIPSGILQTDDERVLVQVTGKFESEADLKQVNFSVGSRILRLSDIATITRGYADPPQPIFRFQGREAIGLVCSMHKGGDILTLGQNMEQAIASVQESLPVGIETHLVANQPEVVRHAVGEFTKALWEAVAIVLGISFLSLGLRAGTIVALSIPLVLAIVFVFMQMLGIDLQRISLGALIISLGLLVDDAMITVESMATKLEEGWDTFRAATFAYTSTAFPMLTGTLVTMFGFIPIGFARSDAGEYTFSLFAVVSIALLVSWVVAVVFAPVIGTMILVPSREVKHEEKKGRFMAWFRRFLILTMRHPKTTIAATLLVFAGSLLLIPLVPNQFFPNSDRPELIVSMSLPQSASIYASDRASKKLDELLKNDPDVDHWSSYVGRGAVRFYLPMDPQLPNAHFSEAIVVTKDYKVRRQVMERLKASAEEQIPEAVVRVSPLEMGPPVGWPVQYRVSGADPVKVREIAGQVARIMGGSPDLEKVNTNWMEPVRKLRIQVNQDQARILGMSSASLAQAVNAVLSGITTTQVRDDIYLVDIVVRAQKPDRTSLETLRGLAVPLPNGKTVPLVELASIEYVQDLPLVWRRDRLPTLTVQADLREGIMPASAVERLQPQIEALSRDLPQGYKIAIGGTVESSRTAQASVAAAAPIMVVLMVTVMMIQLQHFGRLLLVLSVAPLGMIGVVVSLLALGQPLGFIALLGVVALAGMIIRNSVILIHQIEVELEEGRGGWDAVVEATLLRFRPIMLTAAAAILGMIPIVPTVFWGPMANAVMGGLASATLLTLLFLPSLYIVCFGIKEPQTPNAQEST